MREERFIFYNHQNIVQGSKDFSLFAFCHDNFSLYRPLGSTLQSITSYFIRLNNESCLFFGLGICGENTNLMSHVDLWEFLLSMHSSDTNKNLTQMLTLTP